MKRVSATLPPLIALDPAGPPLYRQLSEWLRRAIVEGQLQPGQRLPSTRSLAGELGVSRLPVFSAYEQLLAEGYLEAVAGSGTRVAAAIAPGTPGRPAPPRRRTPGDAPASQERRIARRVAGMTGPEQTWLDSQGAFRIGLPALEAFPHATWARLLSRHARRAHRSSLAYGDPLGHLPLREAIADYLRTVRSVRADASQVMITLGAQHGLQVCMHALLDPGDAAWMEEPGYPGALQALATVGARTVQVPVDAEGLDVAEGIRRGADARMVYTTPSHQFPLGATMSAARRLQLLQWAAREGRWIVEDDYDGEYRFGGPPVAALQGLDADRRVIYVGTFSKVMFPALRVGYVIVPADLVPAFRAVRDALDTCPAMLPQLAMTDFIREGHFARHIRRMRALYALRREALVEAIDHHLPGRLQVVGAEAGMQLTCLLPDVTDDVALSRRAREVGVSIRPLSPCYHGAAPRPGMILGYGGIDEAAIEDGIRRLKRCL
ncbi:PLP-dependent aminotransferase family protein [Dyella lutea]|uniref:PLP-dependent aminotransferase family protein n=1 Tax=Dyella lutea TaxID=2950441 RepID=A0ABT1FBC2_9GAMM|nr:PLP-dependent aminotransferase family protein [Dyella lutea]MCP1374674.1 PLP-dependent aminotransferase family protein [Dyella lutea]